MMRSLYFDLFLFAISVCILSACAFVALLGRFAPVYAVVLIVGIAGAGLSLHLIREGFMNGK